ncbi:MAG: hypothetical protein K8R54_11665 [Bacteroidales bacterium]|nr:hypothetical protein [Bacteroidales bacterium]
MIPYIIGGINSSRHNDDLNDPLAWDERDANYRATQYFGKNYSMDGYLYRIGEKRSAFWILYLNPQQKYWNWFASHIYGP